MAMRVGDYELGQQVFAVHKECIAAGNIFQVRLITGPLEGVTRSGRYIVRICSPSFANDTTSVLPENTFGLPDDAIDRLTEYARGIRKECNL